MRIAMDAIVHEYLVLSLNSVREIAMKVEEEHAREIATMRFLERMLSLETVAHEFDPAENIDVFTSTPRLICYWTKIFPGKILKSSAGDEHIVIEMSGNRSRFFNKRWLSARLRKEGARAWRLIADLDG
jgi:hypothetical protein